MNSPLDSISSSDFRVTHTPVHSGAPPAEAALAEELPLNLGAPAFYVIARDPKTLFAYWRVDWEAAFAHGTPPDRRAHIQLFGDRDVLVKTVAIEPMASSCYLEVEGASRYRAELGFFAPAKEWHLLARAEAIDTPPDALVPSGEYHLATIPFHLSFQRMLDLVRGTKFDTESLATMIAGGEPEARPGEESDSPPSALPEQLLATFHAFCAETGSNGAAPPSAQWVEQRLREFLGETDASSAEQTGAGSGGLR